MRHAPSTVQNPVGLRALDLQLERRPRQQLGDRSLPDDLAAVHDGHGVAGALHLVEQVRREHNGTPFGGQGLDHVAHVEHAGRIQTVHGLVEDEELGVAEQTGGDAETLAHAHGVLGHLVVGPVQDADSFERRLYAVLRRRLARGGQDLQVLAPGEMAVEAGFVDGGPDASQGAVAVPGDCLPRRDMVPASARVSPRSTRISVVLPAPFGPRYPNALPRGTRSSTLSTATLSPNRLLRPCVSTAQSPSLGAGASVTRVMRRHPGRLRAYSV
jgi:hypothetical protein